MSEWLPVVWFGVIGYGVLMYVLLDGFVLGLGILGPLARDEGQLDHMMDTAAPIWDGNETWLVLGGAGLMAAFPKAYALVLSALYLPVLMMLIALVFRGVAFEFRFKATRAKGAWGIAFIAGSILAAFAQGVILGTLVQGLPLEAGRYQGGVWAWLAPFPLATGVAVVCGYALLGAGWLVLKTAGPLHDQARRWARPLVLAVLAGMAMVSLWLPFINSQVMARWFDSGNFLWLAPVPLLAAVVGWRLWSSTSSGSDGRPFLHALALFVLGFVGLVLGMWPYLVPPDLTLWQAASPPSSQGFVLVGLVVLLPLVLGYTAWSYRVFRGKVEAGSHYH
ncbi:MAG: cytochrome d ubiquinol oxidase subunit II [Pseudoxanthomonas suwonensis]|nr:cytochrome d ubiquinol oxidase subunit II [Pseudoxanthomonas suwonensis]